jgi:hypothetical protein
MAGNRGPERAVRVLGGIGRGVISRPDNKAKNGLNRRGFDRHSMESQAGHRPCLFFESRAPAEPRGSKKRRVLEDFQPLMRLC